MNMQMRRYAELEEYIDTLKDRIDELEEENRRKENEIEDFCSIIEELKEDKEQLGIALNNVVNSGWGEE